MTIDDRQKDIEKWIANLRKYHPSDSKRIAICEKCYQTMPITDAWKAVYYLTDEDYANERHAIMFFAEKIT